MGWWSTSLQRHRARAVFCTSYRVLLGRSRSDYQQIEYVAYGVQILQGFRDLASLQLRSHSSIKATTILQQMYKQAGHLPPTYACVNTSRPGSSWSTDNKIFQMQEENCLESNYVLNGTRTTRSGLSPSTST